MPQEAPTCCVVICTRDRPEQLDACVAAVLKQCHPRFDVLVVDNASRGSGARDVAARHGVRYVHEPRTGASHARNRGARESSPAEIVAYVDDDGLPEAGWLEALCAEFGDPRVMCVVGRIVPSEPDTEGARMCIAMGILDGGPQRLVVDRDTPDWFDMMRGGFGGASNMALRRAAFCVWGGFDPRLGRGSTLRGGEEDYAYLSLIKRGYRVVHTPVAVVRHPFPETAAALRVDHLATLAAGVAYLAFLLTEEPECRRAIVRHFLHRIPRGHRRSFQRSPTDARRLAPLWREAWAGLEGLALFSRSALLRRRDARRHGARMATSASVPGAVAPGSARHAERHRQTASGSGPAAP